MRGVLAGRLGWWGYGKEEGSRGGGRKGKDDLRAHPPWATGARDLAPGHHCCTALALRCKQGEAAALPCKKTSCQEVYKAQSPEAVKPAG